MDIEITGAINWIDFKKCELFIYCFKASKKIKVNIFMGNKRLRWMSWRLRTELLRIIAKSREVITVKGYCYNSHTVIATEIDFSQVPGFDHFIEIANNVRKEHKSGRQD